MLEYLVSSPAFFSLFVLLCLSAFFSASEPAILSLNRLQRHAFQRSPSLGRRYALYFWENPGELLTTVLLWNNIVNILYFTVGALLTVSIEREVGSSGAWVFAVAVFFGIVLLGETLPKLISIKKAQVVAPMASGLLFLLSRLTKPIRPLFDATVRHSIRVFGSEPEPQHLTSEELQDLVIIAEESGGLSSSERSIIEEIIELGELRVRDIMVPRPEMVCASVETPIEELRRVARQSKKEKIPIFDGDLDNIIGIVHAKDIFLYKQNSISDCLRDPLFVPEVAKVESLLDQLRATGGTMAVVVDEYGGVTGVAWLEDVLEEIVGEFEAESAEPEVERVSPGKFLLNGSLNLRRLSEMFGVSLGAFRPETVAGLVTMLLGRLPREGDEVIYANLKLTVHQMEHHRIKKILVEVSPADVS